MAREKIYPLMGAFETLLSGSQRDLVFEAVFPYQRGPAPTLRSQQMKRKAECELAQSAEGLKKIWDFFPPVPATESMDHCSYHPPCGLTARGEKRLKWQEDIRALQKQETAGWSEWGNFDSA